MRCELLSKICNFTGFDSNNGLIEDEILEVVNCFQKFVILQGLIPTKVPNDKVEYVL